MRLSKFKKEIKKEFNSTFEEEKYEVYVPNKKRRLGYILSYSFMFVTLLVVGILLGNKIYVATNNNKVDRRRDNINYNVNKDSYFELKSLDNMSIIDEYNTTYKDVYNIYYDMGIDEETTAIPTSVSDTAEPGDLIYKTSSSSYETNNQKSGVEEADLAKFDEKYVYYLYQRGSDSKFIIYDLEGNKIVDMLITSLLDVNLYDTAYFVSYANYITSVRDINFQLYKNKIVIYTSRALGIYEFKENTLETLYLTTFDYLVDTRLVDDKLYVVANYSLNKDYLSDDCYYFEFLTYYRSIVKTMKIDLNTMERKEADSISSSYASFIYMDKDYIVIPSYDYEFEKVTQVSQNGYEYTFYNSFPRTILYVLDTNLNPIGAFKVDGSIVNQYCIDIKDDYLRVVSTRATSIENKINQLVIFDLIEKGKVSAIEEGLGEGRETVKSVTFEGDLCYVVTYRNTDPLYEIDLSDPANPKILSALKVPGYSEYLKSFKINGKDYLLGLGRTDNNTRKISVFEVNNGKNVQVGESFYIGYNEGDDLSSAIRWDLFSDDQQGYFFYNDERYLYFGVQINSTVYSLFKVDVESEKPVSVRKLYYTYSDSRLFLYKGVIYIPTVEKLIIENW